jgi:hypothetical protein
VEWEGEGQEGFDFVQPNQATLSGTGKGKSNCRRAKAWRTDILLFLLHFVLLYDEGTVFPFRIQNRRGCCGFMPPICIKGIVLLKAHFPTHQPRAVTTMLCVPSQTLCYFAIRMAGGLLPGFASFSLMTLGPLTIGKLRHWRNMQGKTT